MSQTAQEMADKIYKRVFEYPGSSFVELMNTLGAEAEGDSKIVFDNYQNIVLWSGTSTMFADALGLCKSKIFPKPTTQFVYFLDGCVLDLPVAKQFRRYKKEHWLPVTFYPRGDN